MLHTKEELQFYQNLPLDIKIKKTKQRIREWYEYYNGDVYVSFSGGKDSTILLYLARQVYSDIPALYVDTGLEYPEIRQFVKTFDNVDIVRPKMRFDEVIKEYGYPVVSKEVSLSVYYVRQGGRTGVRCLKKFNDELEYNGKKSSYNIPQWKYLLDSDFKISHRCCDIMKKSPAKVYEKETNRKPIIGSLADESRIRTQKWIQNGCNAFNSKRPVSNPMSFWTEQDVLEYINKYQIPIASVYGEVVKDKNGKYKSRTIFEESVRNPLSNEYCTSQICNT